MTYREKCVVWERAGRIDTSRLFVECAVVTIIAAGFYFVWPLKPPPAKQ